MVQEILKLKTRRLSPKKAVVSADFQSQTVLTADIFNYVDLWLRREGHQKSLLFWRQARDFYRASQGLQTESAPLVLYYCYLNAVKALLTSKGISYAQIHGVKAENLRNNNSKIVLSNEGIKIQSNGIAPALSDYYGETETRNVHSLEDIFYNLVYIHRAYCLSYKNRRELFLPLENVFFIRDSKTSEAWLSATPVDDADLSYFSQAIPPAFRLDTATPAASGKIHFRTKISWYRQGSSQGREIIDLQNLNTAAREYLQYINGPYTIWYLKCAGNRQISRQSTTLTFIAMHRLSEICRYRPDELQSFLKGSRNWLISEFVNMSPPQFLDEIACEITGHQLMAPTLRTPK